MPGQDSGEPSYNINKWSRLLFFMCFINNHTRLSTDLKVAAFVDNLFVFNIIDYLCG
ncbi:MAG: hypothetical protein PG977_000557 [Bartonella clarridgeiae]|nr:MAG: hypothetical protein PG977_000557 [Bartonella clarridgeiae]